MSNCKQIFSRCLVEKNIEESNITNTDGKQNVRRDVLVVNGYDLYARHNVDVVVFDTLLKVEISNFIAEEERVNFSLINVGRITTTIRKEQLTWLCASVAVNFLLNSHRYQCSLQRVFHTHQIQCLEL
jgi:hypothetical protein